MSSEIIYHTPYIYKITAPDGRFYIGSKTAKGCHPKDFWVKYFTSSKYVKELFEEFPIDQWETELLVVYETRECTDDSRREVVALEQKMIAEAHNDMMINNNVYTNHVNVFTNSEESVEKIKERKNRICACRSIPECDGTITIRECGTIKSKNTHMELCFCASCEGKNTRAKCSSIRAATTRKTTKCSCGCNRSISDCNGKKISESLAEMCKCGCGKISSQCRAERSAKTMSETLCSCCGIPIKYCIGKKSSEWLNTIDEESGLTRAQLKAIKLGEVLRAKEYDIPCPHCDKMFMSKGNLDYHIKHLHSEHYKGNKLPLKTLYVLTSPDDRSYYLVGFRELERFCKENNLCYPMFKYNPNTKSYREYAKGEVAKLNEGWDLFKHCKVRAR